MRKSRIGLPNVSSIIVPRRAPAVPHRRPRVTVSHRPAAAGTGGPDLQLAAGLTGQGYRNTAEIEGWDGPQRQTAQCRSQRRTPRGCPALPRSFPPGGTSVSPGTLSFTAHSPAGISGGALDANESEPTVRPPRSLATAPGIGKALKSLNYTAHRATAKSSGEELEEAAFIPPRLPRSWRCEFARARCHGSPDLVPFVAAQRNALSRQRYNPPTGHGRHHPQPSL